MNKAASNREDNPLAKFGKDFLLTFSAFALITMIQGFDADYVAGMFFNGPLIYSVSYSITFPLLTTVIANVILSKDSKLEGMYRFFYDLSYVMLAILSSLLLVSFWADNTKSSQIAFFLFFAVILAVLSNVSFQRRKRGENESENIFCRLLKIAIALIISFVYLVIVYVFFANALDVQSCIIQFNEYSIVCNVFERFPFLKSIQDFALSSWNYLTTLCSGLFSRI